MSIFDNESKPPSDEQVAVALGKTAALWRDLKEHLYEEFGEISGEWRFYGKSSGWTPLIKSKKRMLFYLYPAKVFS